MQSKTARECALSLLERADRTEKEMRQKLLERQYSSEEIEKSLCFLKEYHYIDDAAYASRYAHSHALAKNVRQIRGYLEQKGVAREWIDRALEQVEVDEEAQIYAYIRRKGYSQEACMESAACRKLTAALLRRGFSYDSVRRVIQRISEEEIW